MAFFTHDTVEPIGPDNEWAQPNPPPTPHDQAEALRDEAIGACDEGRWALCRNKLDDARKLDPGGETAARVQKARGAIESGLHPDGGGKKGGP